MTTLPKYPYGLSVEVSYRQKDQWARNMAEQLQKVKARWVYVSTRLNPDEYTSDAILMSFIQVQIETIDRFLEALKE